MIDTGRRRHRREVMQILARVLVALHVARRAGQQLLGCFTVGRKASDAHADVNGNAFPGSDRKLMGRNRSANSFGNAFGHHLRGHRHYCDKFIAGIARQDIHLSQFLANDAGNARQQTIADREYQTHRKANKRVPASYKNRAHSEVR